MINERFNFSLSYSKFRRKSQELSEVRYEMRKKEEDEEHRRKLNAYKCRRK